MIASAKRPRMCPLSLRTRTDCRTGGRLSSATASADPRSIVLPHCPVSDVHAALPRVRSSRVCGSAPSGTGSS
jgi:hypothetical protein